MPVVSHTQQPIEPGHPGERVGLLRRRKGWSLADLAGYAGVMKNTVRNLELGKGYSASTLQKIARALETTPSALLVPIE